MSCPPWSPRCSVLRAMPPRTPRLRTVSVPHRAQLDRCVSNPPTRPLNSTETLDLVRYLNRHLHGGPGDASFVRIMSFDEAMKQVAHDMWDPHGKPRRILIVNDGESGSIGSHWFTVCYDVCPRGRSTHSSVMQPHLSLPCPCPQLSVRPLSQLSVRPLSILWQQRRGESG